VTTTNAGDEEVEEETLAPNPAPVPLPAPPQPLPPPSPDVAPVPHEMTAPSVPTADAADAEEDNPSEVEV